MKKIFCAVSVLVMTMVSAYANTDDPNDKAERETRKEVRKEKREERRELWLHSATVQTEDQFNEDFPGAKQVSWTEGRFAEASFVDGGIQKTAYYDNDNALVGTTTHVDPSVLPGKANRSIQKEYPGYKIEKVILFDDNETNDTDMFLYGSSFADEDVYFPVLTNGSKKIILKVTMGGDVSFFQDYK